MSPRPFRAMRYVALSSHALVALLWLILAPSVVWEVALPFITGWWLMITSELIYAAMRRQSPIANAVASLLTSAWFVIIGCWILYSYVPAGSDWVALFTVSIGAVAAAAGEMASSRALDKARSLPARLDNGTLHISEAFSSTYNTITMHMPLIQARATAPLPPLTSPLK